MSAAGNKGSLFTIELIKHAFVLGILAAAFFPLYVMLNISLKTNKQFYHNTYGFETPVHTENYSAGWDIIGASIPNTIFIAVTSTAGALAAAILAAYVFARYKFPFKVVLWSALMVLMLMPDVANLVPLFTLLRDMGLLNSFSALILTGASAAQVFNIYILRNCIEDTSESLFEAAEMDGAGHLRQILEIVLPMNASVIATLACLLFVRNWNNFLLPLLILRDPAKLPTSVALYRLDGAYVRLWGPTMAAYAIAAAPLVILFVFTMRYFVRGAGAGALKE